MLQNLEQTVVNMFLSINISNFNNIKKFWVTSIKPTKQEWVSQWVRDKGRQWSDLDPIKVDLLDYYESISIWGTIWRTDYHY